VDAHVPQCSRLGRLGVVSSEIEHRSVRRPGGFGIRPAQPGDAEAAAACVKAAYSPYVERNGKLPGPMRDDYAKVISEREVYVAFIDSAIVGVLVLAKEEEGLLLDNVAVLPAVKGQGIGRALLELAERSAARQGYTSIFLYTQDVMTENLALYAKIGYVEYARRTEAGLNRVYMRKRL